MKLALRGAAAGKRGSAHRKGFFRVSSPRRGDGKIKGKGRPGTLKPNGRATASTYRCYVWLILKVPSIATFDGIFRATGMYYNARDR